MTGKIMGATKKKSNKLRKQKVPELQQNKGEAFQVSVDP